jgi:N-hydroxyarylamine O-acetyltransferase
VDTNRYLERIGFGAAVRRDAATLEGLQRAHLTAVPFENLDVYHRCGVRTDAAWSVAKVVERGRGGWCYELNGAFAALLEALGFEVTRLGATVLIDESTNPSGTEPDHLALEIALDRPYLVDVGFGDSYIRPLPLDDPGPHDGGTGQFAFQIDEEWTTLVQILDTGAVEPQYRFRRRPVALSVFDPESARLQTQPGLRWSESPFATRLLDGGPDRVTLLGDRLKIRRDGVWGEEPVAPEAWAAALHDWFGMEP